MKSKDFKNYKIKEGRHYSNGVNLSLTLKNSNTCSAFFDYNCLYTITGENRDDINKLWGFSSAIHHQIQSARIGWRCLDGENIEILCYTYKGGEINFDEIVILDTIKPKEIFTCTIERTDTSFIFKYIRDDFYKEHTVSKNCDSFPIHYFLHPYFGGNEVAPHDMDIYLQY